MLKMLGNKVNLGGSIVKKCMKLKALGLFESEDSIKPVDVHLFGNDEYKSHAAIAISRTKALKAYRHYEDENCAGMLILTRPISEIRRLYKMGKYILLIFYKKKLLLMEKNI